MGNREVRTPSAEDVERAWSVVRAVLPPTPVVGEGPLLKLESLQPTGSFKVRGALNALAAIGRGEHVVTASAGNHGLGVAFAATRLGRPATVVVPENASSAKIAALGRFDIELVREGRSYAEAEAHALRLAERGAYFLSPYNDPHVIAGQGTIGHELAEQLTGRRLTVVCAVGGGGLASGLGLWAATQPDVRIVGVEVDAAPSMAEAVKAGHQVPIEVRPTIADGIAANLEPGSVTIDLVAKHVDRIVSVTETELRAAVRHLAATHGVVTEGAGAAAVAALLAGKVESRGDSDRLVALVSGRNIALGVLAEVLASSQP
ncbi:threonine dehydratase [Saccharomonospora marina XMU15]|uniref:Threonine dehydratase n=1 Tax=Saccharomonospora marina XMU15 TaxID=882083 RepID=H5X9K0_9PSEU|nr:pyridoxal-phosphate dependent enzyme [Saccharomonospora marina]EHR50365.1 threonine dehydratase [Saccharomonospora marina XMU15]